MNALRVLHVTNAYPCEDTPEYGIFIKEQIDSLEGGIENRVIFINGRSQGKFAYLKVLPSIWKATQWANVVHCHHVYSFVCALLAGTSLRRPIITSFLNDWTLEVKDLKVTWLKTMVCRLCVRISSVVIFKSPVPIALEGHSKAINLPNGVDGDVFNIADKRAAREEIGLDPTALYLLFVSSKNKYREQKRYDIFTKVLEQVQAKMPESKCLEFAMVGQPRDLVPAIFSACDVHVLTSDYEGSPNSVKEALCCGTPVVCRDVGNVREMLDGVEGGRVIDTDDPEVIAAAVVEVLRTAPSRREVRSSFLAKGITKNLVAQRLTSIYRELAAGRMALE